MSSFKNPDPLPPEDELVAALTRGLPQTDRTVNGPGDDCAVVRVSGAPMLQLLKADAVVERIHFTREMPPGLTGRKALARAVSDIAAMGGVPREALITAVLPPDLEFSWLMAFYAGLKQAALEWGVGLAGGETSSAPPGSPVMVSVALTGEIREDRVIGRGGARPGDVIAVTGRLGGSFAGGWHLNFVPRLAEGQWLVEHFPPRAMMDLSDGLAKDLPRLAAASGTGWRLHPERLPLRAGADIRQALGDGEDYELLAVFAPDVWAALQDGWAARFPETPLTGIGEIAEHAVQDPEMSGGWDHFGERVEG